MKTKNYFTLFGLLLFAFLVFGCRNDDDSPTPEPTCRMTTLTDEDGTVYNFSYNSDGKVSNISGMKDGESFERTFTYEDGKVETLWLKNGAFYRKYTLTLNDNGMLLNKRAQLNESNTNWRNRAYEYNGTQLVKIIRSNQEGSAGEITYTWSNGNIATSTAPWGSSAYQYYTDKNYQPGDGLTPLNIVSYGKYDILIRNKNLIKSIEYYNGDIGNFEYEFDEKGHIIKFVQSFDSGISETVSFTYTCE